MIITDAKAAFVALFAGLSVFTLTSKKTGTRYTFKVAKPNQRGSRHPDHEADAVFVSLLTGPCNKPGKTGDWSYFAWAKPSDATSEKRWDRENSLRYGNGKARVGKDAPSAKAFKWFWDAIVTHGHMPSTIEMRPMSYCLRCGAELTVDQSIDQCYGPECINKVGC